MKLPKFILAFGMMVALSGFIGMSSASADNCHTPRVRCGYKTVTIIVEKEVPYRKRVVRYDSCGHRYYKWIKAYKIVEFPKRIRVKTCNY
jgi:hypothetical protein